MGKGCGIAIIGGSGTVGKELAAALLKSERIRIGQLKLFSSVASAGEQFYIADKPFKLQLLPKDPLEGDLFDDIDIVCLATPASVSQRLLPIFAEEGMVVVDIGGGFSERLPLAAFQIDEQEEFFAEERLVATPSAPAMIVGQLLWPLRSRGLIGARVQFSLGASYAGKHGVEELSKQIGALYNYRDPPRKIFPEGLAFDMISTVGSIQEDGSTDREQYVRRELASLLSISIDQLDVGMQYVPLFSGLVAQLHVRMEQDLEKEELEEILRGLPSVVLGVKPVGPKRLLGMDSIHVGRLRPDGLGDGFHLWVSADNVIAGAVRNIVSLIEHYIERDLL
ncbi:MAG: Asd/ArgC dimerization domain-containing protein [Myxococcota bacterium]|nr:Asd/ArgC dimerization domain-containing protein [Myxococcota bacterium]